MCNSFFVRVHNIEMVEDIDERKTNRNVYLFVLAIDSGFDSPLSRAF